jgi:RecB family exonuclease
MTGFSQRAGSLCRQGFPQDAGGGCQAVAAARDDGGAMPLRLITGPANAGKAAELLGELRDRAGRDPLLVVPTRYDVAAYRTELAASGTVFGPRVMRFEELAQEIVLRCGAPVRLLGGAQRERLLALSARDAGLLGAGPATPGLITAAGTFVAELQRELVDPPRLVAALRQWADGDPARRRHADRVGGLYLAYRRRLDALGRVDADLLAWRALDALGTSPAAWGTTPVSLYGFDDLTAVQRETLARLSQIEGVDVTVALTFEAGHAALAGRARAVADLTPLAAGVEVLPALDDYYAPDARTALHQLERHLFDDAPPLAVPAGDAVSLARAGGERAEIELAAAAARRLIDAGFAPSEIAVAVRDVAGAAPLARRVFGAYGVPLAADARMPLSHGAYGAGLLALLKLGLARAGTPGVTATADDVVVHLRTPGLVDRSELVDALEARLRRGGIADAEPALAAWEDLAWPLDAVGRVAGAAAAGSPALLDRVRAEADRLLSAGHQRAAAVLDADELPDAQAAVAVRQALTGLAELARHDRALAPDGAELFAALAGVEVAPPASARDAVALVEPLALRARRVRALIVCGLEEGTFPRRGAPEPFLSDGQRIGLAEAAGLVLRAREDVEGDERALFYACVSRPTERLVLCHRDSDDDGDPVVPSPYLDEVSALLTGVTERSRTLADVTWPLEDAPTDRERARAQALAGPRHAPATLASLTDPGVLADLRGRPSWTAGAVERYAQCPASWLVDTLLRAEPLEPPAEELGRGTLAHNVMERTLSGVREQTGSARVTRESLALAREILLGALKEEAAEHPLSRDPARHQSMVRRLESDLLRLLDATAAADCALEPTHLELPFGAAEGLPALDLGDGLAVRGRIDRIDVRGDEAAVLDYKGTSGAPAVKWVAERRLQAALYGHAVEQLLGLRLVAALYQPVSTTDQRPRGIADGDSAAAALAHDRDVKDADALHETIDEVLDVARGALRAMRDGQIEPCPKTCYFGGDRGCRYPGICRSEDL